MALVVTVLGGLARGGYWNTSLVGSLGALGWCYRRLRRASGRGDPVELPSHFRIDKMA